MQDIRILIYGDGADEAPMQSLLDRATPILHREKEYVYITDRDRYIDELLTVDYDLVIVSANGEEGLRAIQDAKQYARVIPRLWISDILDYALDAYRYNCLWFLLKPIDEIILQEAMIKFIDSEHAFQIEEVLHEGGLR